MDVQSSFFYRNNSTENTMLTLKTLRDDPEMVIRKLAVKHFDAREIVGRILTLDANRRSLQQESDELLSQQKAKAAVIGGLMKERKPKRQRKRLPS